MRFPLFNEIEFSIATIGAERNEVHVMHSEHDEIWMKKWDPMVFAKGVVVLAVSQSLTRDLIEQLGARAVRYSNATVDVSGFRQAPAAVPRAGGRRFVSSGLTTNGPD